MRMSTAHSMPEEDDEVRAPANSSSSLTQGNLDYMTASASAAGKPPPLPSMNLQIAGSSGASHVQQQQQQMSNGSLPKGQTVTSPSQQAVDVHPLQAELQQPAAISTQESTRDSNQPGTSDGVQAQDQNLGSSGEAKDGEGLSQGAALEHGHLLSSTVNGQSWSGLQVRHCLHS